MNILKQIALRPLRRTYINTLRRYAARASGEGRGRWNASNDNKEDNAPSGSKNEQYDQQTNPYAKPKPDFEIPDVRKVLEDYRGTSKERLHQQLAPIVEMVNDMHDDHSAQRQEYLESKEKEKKRKKTEQLQKLAREKSKLTKGKKTKQKKSKRNQHEFVRKT